MEREWLERELAAGRSIESIAREVGRHPSTVAYWVNRHGLTSQHAERHAARGGLAPDVLAADVAEGLSVRAIAERRGVSYATVRHWLAKHGLETRRTARSRELRASIEEGAEVTATCPIHGRTRFVRRADGGYRCAACRSEQVSARRRELKSILVREAGGACRLCGYDRAVAALQFHHVDPEAKEFQIAHRGVARALEAARSEAAKCVLLCVNCHAEVEAGIATLFPDPADNPG
jgi:transposase